MMPNFSPVGIEVITLTEMTGEFSSGQVYHPILKIPDGRIVVDVWIGEGQRLFGKAWRKADHPNLANLPADAPRAVKHLYTADGQLAQMRASDYYSMPSTKAYEAWGRYTGSDGLQ